jgi:hypothetical protein
MKLWLLIVVTCSTICAQLTQIPTATGGGGGSGTVTHTSGALTLNQLVFGAGGADTAIGDLTGDITTSGGKTTTLTTVNSGPGACGDSTHVCVVTTNGKGLVTTQSTALITGAGGSVSVDLDGSLIGTRSIVNFVTGNTLVPAITDTGSQINIQIEAGPKLQTLANSQSGAALLCAPASTSPTTYTCLMSPTLAVGSLVPGATFLMKWDVSCTPGAVTINIDALGAKAYKESDGSTNPILNDCTAGHYNPITYDGTVFRRADDTGSGGGGVSSVSFTGGLISVANPTTTPALTVAGTSGGIPYFSAASTWASSAALTANGVVLGGGAGAAPTVTTADTNPIHALFATAGAPAFRTIGQGDIILAYIGKTINFASAVADGSCSAFVTGIALTGAFDGTPLTITPATSAAYVQGYQFFAVGDGVGTFKAQFCNLSGGPVTLGSASYSVK